MCKNELQVSQQWRSQDSVLWADDAIDADTGDARFWQRLAERKDA